MKSKRGLSPLLATLLLIVLASGLGILVMNFGRAQIEIAAQCAVDIGLQFVELEGNPEACHDKKTGELFFIVENGQQIPVELLRLRVIGDKEVFAQDITESKMEKLGTALKRVPYDFAKYGAVRQLRLTPTITLYDEEIICPEQSIALDNIRDCQ